MSATVAFVDQEFLHDPENGVLGDCFRACIASVVGRPLSEVPHFVRDFPNVEGDDTAQWFAATQRWLAQLGVMALFYDNPRAARADARAEVSAYPHILIDGISPRFPGVHHVVVGDAITGEILHDPHPDRTGLTEVTGAFVLVALASPGEADQ